MGALVSLPNVPLPAPIGWHWPVLVGRRCVAKSVVHDALGGPGRISSGRHPTDLSEPPLKQGMNWIIAGAAVAFVVLVACGLAMKRWMTRETPERQSMPIVWTS